MFEQISILKPEKYSEHSWNILDGAFCKNVSIGQIWVKYGKSINYYQERHPPEVFYRKGFLKNFLKTHKKTTVLESLLNKVAGLKTPT